MPWLVVTEASFPSCDSSMDCHAALRARRTVAVGVIEGESAIKLCGLGLEALDAFRVNAAAQQKHQICRNLVGALDGHQHHRDGRTGPGLGGQGSKLG